MRLEINDGEDPKVLRALSAFMNKLADLRESELAEFDAAVAKADLVPLTDGDAPAFPISASYPAGTIVEGLDGQHYVVKESKPVQGVTIPEPPDAPIEKPEGGAKRTRRTRAQIAADKLAAAPTAPAGEQLQLVPTAPDVPQVPCYPAPAAPLAPAAPVAAPEVPTAPAVPATGAGLSAALNSVPAPPATTTPPVPIVTGPATNGDAPKTFPEFMRAISPALASKKLTADQLNAACAQAGATNLQGLLQSQALVPDVFELVRGAL